MPEYQFRAAFRSTVDVATECVNVFHFQVAKLSSPFDAVDAANEVSTKLTTAYKAMLGTADTFHDITVTQVGMEPDLPAQAVKSLEVAGTRSLSGRALETGLTCVVALKTGTPKRFARGRFFAPPPVDQNHINSGGVWLQSGSYIVAVKAFAALLTAPWTAGDDDFEAIIWSPIQKQRALQAAFPITSYSSDYRQHFLRKRSGLGS